MWKIGFDTAIADSQHISLRRRTFNCNFYLSPRPWSEENHSPRACTKSGIPNSSERLERRAIHPLLLLALLDHNVDSLHTKSMLNTAISCGFAPDCRTSSVTPLIDKRLRNIHLKLRFGKQQLVCLNWEKDQQVLNDQQLGSQSRRMPTDLHFLARLEKDWINQTRASKAYMVNDTTGCCNCIVISLGMIAGRCLGLIPYPVRLQSNKVKDTLAHTCLGFKVETYNQWYPLWMADAQWEETCHDWILDEAIT